MELKILHQKEKISLNYKHKAIRITLLFIFSQKKYSIIKNLNLRGNVIYILGEESDKSEKIFMQNINGNNNKYLNITYYSLLDLQGFEQYLMQHLFHKHCQQLSTLKSSFHYL